MNHRRRRLFCSFVLPWVLLLMPVVSRGQEVAIEEVRAAQEARFRAMMAMDLGALDHLLAEDLVYTHTTGQVETKREFMGSLAGNFSYESIEPRSVRAEMFGSAAVLSGTSDMRVRAGDRKAEFTIRFLEVHTKRDGRWQLVAWQSTRVPNGS